MGNKSKTGLRDSSDTKEKKQQSALGNQNSLGIKQSRETRRKKSIALMGNQNGPDMKEVWKGRSKEERTRITRPMLAAQTGKPSRLEHAVRALLDTVGRAPPVRPRLSAR